MAWGEYLLAIGVGREEAVVVRMSHDFGLVVGAALHEIIARAGDVILGVAMILHHHGGREREERGVSGAGIRHDYGAVSVVISKGHEAGIAT